MKNKNLLIITQTVDERDSNLGFFCGWLREFSKQADKVYVIANKVGEYNLPDNVVVSSLKKEEDISRFKRIFIFWSLLFKYLPKVRSVLIHMCPEYIVYGGWVARLFGKKVGIWYLHKSLTWKLKLSHIITNYVFTAHIDGFPIKSHKVIATGHGIDLNIFSNIESREVSPRLVSLGMKDDEFVMLTVGRVSSSKNLLILVKSVIILQKKLDKKVRFLIVGEPYLDEDREYLEELKSYLKREQEEELVEFVGKVPYENIVEYYKRADLFLNASRTGGVDKAVLEAMASGLPVITSNFTFKNILPENCLFEDGDLNDLVEKITKYKEINTDSLRDAVFKNHSLESTVEQIIKKLL
ncbi:MAG: hypothetical protein A2725_01180 [Candidatus Magasanikbacteria bacterium RIFCSPHIGHO2_01_FULL_33_34]|uniref:Glycosyl transferase family 1 domain-containing protein n=1 Tax=Candidatus Magasanikbacteria bacterium RIFCSPHIGHO2_01_FULL_33_34 TaxID=1798671 RepID=A0A1F6LJF8_9BACT|nr:MAG: hypothetical protein A2725_01180 [Candidatus Magasanikbacteria bacterium RIFCSPHIGHO2_01_FULL_33_34]OGH65367.1 MAG: hypothetical protein A3B83_04840 [Candidatus Magasanikbacteria bacterium RIFCSPHIGHO2_02_FULL_33_17]OGH76143.1 MAG: hypothetical protein A3A89_01760 [Candidatus Magasanikbacteria bacterium RIFCSPLOWO2_01_FULL_33_34]